MLFLFSRTFSWTYGVFWGSVKWIYLKYVHPHYPIDLNDAKMVRKGIFANPTNVGIAMGTLTLGGDTSGSLAMGGGRHLGCYKVFNITNISLI